MDMKAVEAALTARYSISLDVEGAKKAIGIIEDMKALLATAAQQDSGWRSKAADDVLAERKRQIEAEGWTPKHDDAHRKGEILAAAECYFLNAIGDSFGGPLGFYEGKPNRWPWKAKWWKPKNPRQDLVRAGALAVAERERIQRTFAAEAYMRQGGIRIEGLYKLILAEIDRLDRLPSPKGGA